MVGTVLTSLFQQYLLEALIGLALLVNVSAFAFLWNYTRDIEQDTDEELGSLKKKFSQVDREMAEMQNTVYGRKQDETDKGHLVETKERFDSLERCIEQSRQERKQEHQEVRRILVKLVTELSNSDDIDIDFDATDIQSE